MNEGLYVVRASHARSGGYVIVRQPSEAQRVTAALLGEECQDERVSDILSFKDAAQQAKTLNRHPYI